MTILDSRTALWPQPVIAERLPVWTALSELFLDTELMDDDHQRIAAILHQSPYSVAELERILRNEVTPAFGFNLAAVAGEWAGWTDEAVQEIMVKSLRRKPFPAWLTRFVTSFAWKSIQHDWQRILALLD
jgi:hypothetical protein